MTAQAIIDPTLQPNDLRTRHNAVIAGKVSALDEDAGTVKIAVTEILKGEFTAKEVTITVTKEAAEACHAMDADDMTGDRTTVLDDVSEGDVVVAFVGGKGRRGKGRVQLYVDEQWHVAKTVATDKTEEWIWEKSQASEMFGLWKGYAVQLQRMMRDAQAGRYFFPSTPSVILKEELLIDTFPGPIRGVAMHDLDGDGDLDIYACHPDGNRAYEQISALTFTDATEAWGLKGVSSLSCNMADVNGDGVIDLLAGTQLLLGKKGGFAKAKTISKVPSDKLIVAAFVEIDGDGYPDIVLSVREGGLNIWLNPGAKGGDFSDATEALGLDKKELGAGATAFVTPGDWNGDGRCDLVYSANLGLLLINGKDGFTLAAENLLSDQDAMSSSLFGLTGAGMFGSQEKPGSRDVVIPGVGMFNIMANFDGEPEEISYKGNECAYASGNQYGTLVADLNMDGYPDLYTITSGADGSMFHCNRGYGQYMKSVSYLQHTAFPGKAHDMGAGGAVTADINNDGALDLLLGSVDGGLKLCLNDCRSLREPTANPLNQAKVLQQVSYLTVNVTGKTGVLGAEISVFSDDGRILALSMIGGELLTGCRGSNAGVFALRETGKMKISVRYSDGRIKEKSVEVEARATTAITIE